MSQGVALRRARRRPRPAVAVPLLSALILVLGWGVLWAVARAQAGAGLDGFIADEAAHGRRWSCPERRIDGFPFVVAVSCRAVGFEGPVDGSPARGSLAGFTARAWLYEPSAVYLVLRGPMSLRSDDGRADFTLGWERLGAKLRGVFGDRPRAEVVGEGLRLDRPGAAGATARRVELRTGPAPAAAGAAPAAAGAAAVEVALAGVAAPALDALAGEAAPLDGAFTGTVTGAMGNLPDLGPATVERWRRAGGRLEVGALRLSKGPLTLGATGALGLDARHRLDGRLDATLGGFGPLLRRYGVSDGAFQVGSLIAGLFGGRAAPAPAPGTVSLPVVFADGTASVGPFEVALRPLY